MGIFTLYCLFLIPNVIGNPKIANEHVVRKLSNEGENVPFNSNGNLGMPLKSLINTREVPLISTKTGLRSVGELIKRSLNAFPTGNVSAQNFGKTFSNSGGHLYLSNQRNFGKKSFMNSIIKKMHLEASGANDERISHAVSNSSRCLNRDRPWNKLCCPKEIHKNYVRPWNVRNCTECASSSICPVEPECSTVYSCLTTCCKAHPIPTESSKVSTFFNTVASKESAKSNFSLPQNVAQGTFGKQVNCSVQRNATNNQTEVIKTKFMQAIRNYNNVSRNEDKSLLEAICNSKNLTDAINTDNKKAEPFLTHFTHGTQIHLPSVEKDQHTEMARGQPGASVQRMSFLFNGTPQANHSIERNRKMEDILTIPFWPGYRDVPLHCYEVLRNQNSAKQKKNAAKHSLNEEYINSEDNGLRGNFFLEQEKDQIQTMNNENDLTLLKNNQEDKISENKIQNKRIKSPSSKWHHRKAQRHIREDKKKRRYQQFNMKSLRKNRLKNADKHWPTNTSIMD